VIIDAFEAKVSTQRARITEEFLRARVEASVGTENHESDASGSITMTNQCETEHEFQGRSITEVYLWRAVIFAAIQEWRFGPLRLKRQAKDYLFQDNIDFAFVCQSAEIDVGQLRARLAKLQDQTGPTDCPIAA